MKLQQWMEREGNELRESECSHCRCSSVVVDMESRVRLASLPEEDKLCMFVSAECDACGEMRNLDLEVG
jgi:hypothetical protein